MPSNSEIFVPSFTTCGYLLLQFPQLGSVWCVEHKIKHKNSSPLQLLPRRLTIFPQQVDHPRVTKVKYLAGWMLCMIWEFTWLGVHKIGMPPPGMPPMMGRGMPPPGMPQHQQYMHPGMRGQWLGLAHRFFLYAVVKICATCFKISNCKSFLKIIYLRIKKKKRWGKNCPPWWPQHACLPFCISMYTYHQFKCF